MAPICNVAHSMWESVNININDRDITANAALYPYKAYISNTLSYDDFVKANQLSTQGYYKDFAGHMNVLNNSGFDSRNNLFRKSFDPLQPYREDGAVFIANLHHDLVNTEPGLPPGTKVKIELTRSTDKFVLMKEEDDNTKYKLKLVEIQLFVPIAQLSERVFNEINLLRTKTTDNKPIGLQYRRLDVRPIIIPQHAQDFWSDLLLRDDVPARVVLVFVETEAKDGDMTLNPFNFQRRWKVKKQKVTKSFEQTPQQSNSSTDDELLKRVKQLEELNRQLIEKFKDLEENIPLSASKTKGKAAASTRRQSEQSSSTGTISRNLRGVRLNDLNEPDLQNADEQLSVAESAPSSEASRRIESLTTEVFDDEDFETLYIKKVDLQINGTSIDQGSMKNSLYIFMLIFVTLSKTFNAHVL